MFQLFIAALLALNTIRVIDYIIAYNSPRGFVQLIKAASYCEDRHLNCNDVGIPLNLIKSLNITYLISYLAYMALYFTLLYFNSPIVIGLSFILIILSVVKLFTFDIEFKRFINKLGKKSIFYFVFHFLNILLFASVLSQY